MGLCNFCVYLIYVCVRAQVILVKDDVARIFGASTRAKKLLPELEPGAASAVCLSR